MMIYVSNVFKSNCFIKLFASIMKYVYVKGAICFLMIL